MLIMLAKELPSHHPNIMFECYGIDVDDSHAQQEGYFKNTIHLLAETAAAFENQTHPGRTQTDILI